MPCGRPACLRNALTCLFLAAGMGHTSGIHQDRSDELRILNLVFPLDQVAETGGIKNLPVTITLPALSTQPKSQHKSKALKVAAPTALFFNGFKLKASFYRAYASRLAEGGYAVVQYDTPLLKTPTDAVEVAFLPKLLDWLKMQVEDSSSCLSGELDLERLVAAGHSRGGKLAALHLAGDSRISAACLIDPVDNTQQTPESPEYPSACTALRKAGKMVAVTGAGLVGPCNPNGSNYKAFFEAVQPGSWLMDVLGAGHTSFFRAPWLLQKAFDLLCRSGSDSHKEAMDIAVRPMQAWFDRRLQIGEGNQEAFFQWVKSEEQLGKISFEVKGQKLPSTSDEGHTSQTGCSTVLLTA